MSKITSFFTCSLLGPEFPICHDKDMFSGPGTYHMRGLFSAFRGTTKGQSILLAPAVSLVTFIQNNQYAKVAHFGKVYFALLHSP